MHAHWTVVGLHLAPPLARGEVVIVSITGRAERRAARRCFALCVRFEKAGGQHKDMASERTVLSVLRAVLEYGTVRYLAKFAVRLVGAPRLRVLVRRITIVDGRACAAEGARAALAAGAVVVHRAPIFAPLPLNVIGHVRRARLAHAAGAAFAVRAVLGVLAPFVALGDGAVGVVLALAEGE